MTKVLDVEDAEFKFFPDRIENYKQKDIDFLNKFFCYKLIVVSKNSKTANSIFFNSQCSYCQRKLFVVNIYNKKILSVSFFRMCHRCKIIYLLTGSFVNFQRFKRVLKGMNVLKKEKKTIK